jgi:hypothetical protein
MHFDWSINVGELIAAFVLLGGFMTAHSQNVKKLQEMDTKLTIMYAWFEARVVNRQRRGD